MQQKSGAPVAPDWSIEKKESQPVSAALEKNRRGVRCADNKPTPRHNDGHPGLSLRGKWVGKERSQASHPNARGSLSLGYTKGTALAVPIVFYTMECVVSQNFLS